MIIIRLNIHIRYYRDIYYIYRLLKYFKIQNVYLIWFIFLIKQSEYLEWRLTCQCKRILSFLETMFLEKTIFLETMFLEKTTFLKTISLKLL